MVCRIGINGFGRIGRQVFRIIAERGSDVGIQVVAINGRGSPAQLAHLLEYDSTYGRFAGRVEATTDGLLVNGLPVAVSAAPTPAEAPWREHGVDLVVEATGRFTSGPEARGHLTAGAARVLITAPADAADVTIVPGVNNAVYDPAVHRLVSAASCTTNCLAPVAAVLLERFGIRLGMATTIHAYTNDQVLLDKTHDDPRRGRGAGQNLVPATTGAAELLTEVIPTLAGKIAGAAVRVPMPSVSLADLVVVTERPASVEMINAAFAEAAAGAPLRGILGYSDLPLVSSDYRQDPRSAIVDGLSTTVVGDTLARVSVWYDNEWGYSNRVVDLIALLANENRTAAEMPGLQTVGGAAGPAADARS